MNVVVDAMAATPPYEQIRAQVARMVGGGVLAPGARLPTIQQLANDQQRLNSFTDTDVISHQQPDCFLTQRHDQGHHLVTPWPE